MARKKNTTVTSTTAPETPAVVLAALSPGFSPTEVKFIQAALSSKSYLEAVEALIPNETQAQIDVTLRARGTLKRGAAGERKGTSRALSKAALALFIRYTGITREAALGALEKALVEAVKLDETAEKKVLEEHPEVGTAFERLDAFTDTLPKIPTRGTFTTADVLIERVLMEGHS